MREYVTLTLQKKDQIISGLFHTESNSLMYLYFVLNIYFIKY